MSYSRIWTDATPVGTDPSKNAPIDMQHIRVDLRERLMTMFDFHNFTDDPLEVSALHLGYGVSTFGGHIDYTNDTGVLKWRAGLDNGAGSVSFIVRDVVNNANRLAIDATSGNVSFSNSLQVGANPGQSGGIGIPNNKAITARNAANTADVNLIYLSGTNVITFDSSAQFTTGGSLTLHGGNIVLDSGNITLQGDITNAHVSITNAGGISTTASITANAVTVGSTGLAVNGPSTLNGALHVTTGGALVTGTIEASALVSDGTLYVTSSSTLSGTVSANAINCGAINCASLAASGAISASGNIGAAAFYGNGANLTSITGANVTGTVANATNATNASNSTSLGGVGASSYALLSGASFTGNISVPHANSISAGAFYVV